jgi:acyl-CoA synthetase (AMP-forming)/AMP-acid ligase II
VEDAAAVGLPDENSGELPLAWVVRKPSATVTELQLQQYVSGTKWHFAVRFNTLKRIVLLLPVYINNSFGISGQKILLKKLSVVWVCSLG